MRQHALGLPRPQEHSISTVVRLGTFTAGSMTWRTTSNCDQRIASIPGLYFTTLDGRFRINGTNLPVPVEIMKWYTLTMAPGRVWIDGVEYPAGAIEGTQIQCDPEVHIDWVYETFAGEPRAPSL